MANTCQQQRQHQRERQRENQGSRGVKLKEACWASLSSVLSPAANSIRDYPSFEGSIDSESDLRACFCGCRPAPTSRRRRTGLRKPPKAATSSNQLYSSDGVCGISGRSMESVERGAVFANDTATLFNLYLFGHQDHGGLGVTSLRIPSSVTAQARSTKRST
jgi:hypothetical protein